MRNLFLIEGKVAIVTGGSSGIGAMIARGFVENGVRTYITARTEKNCQLMVESLSQYGECVAIPGDISTPEGIEAFARSFGQQEEKLDILVNNAGRIWSAPFKTLSESGWDETMNINLKSVFFLTQRLHEHLKKAASLENPARVINISSVNGMPDLGTAMNAIASPYPISKAGVIQLTRHLAILLSKDHITVNSLSPACFPSKDNDSYLKEHSSEVARDYPLGRIGTPEDIAGAVIYLSSRAGAWVTGINIPVDGGLVVKR